MSAIAYQPKAAATVDPAIDVKAAESNRVASLDQFRGYTVLGMLLVNFLGGYAVISQLFPVLLHHHTYCSYADTIMPQFFFAVGFAYRFTLMRRLEKVGPRAAYLQVVRRNLGLILLGIVVYHLEGGVQSWSELQNKSWWDLIAPLKRRPFETLVHIGVTSLWVMPVIAAGPWVRVAFAAGSGLLHVYLSYGLAWPFGIDWSNYVWANQGPVAIDGGPLGFLTWTIPLLLGSLACDALSVRRDWTTVLRFMVWGGAVMALGYAISCVNTVTPPNVPGAEAKAWLVESPFVPPTRPVNMWTMSQRSGSLSYLTFSAGFALAVFALFVAACDLGRLRLGIFATFGSNALAAYVIHYMVSRAVKPFAPRDAPFWYVAAAFSVFLAICYLFVRHLEKHRLFLRL